MRDSGLEEGHGEDRTPSRHTLNSLSLFQPLQRRSLHFIMFSPSTSSPSLPLSSFHIFITLFPLSISPCVSAKDHTVFHIPPQLMTNSNTEPLHLPPPPQPPLPLTHTPFQLFLPPLKTSQHFFICSPSSSVSTSLLPVEISPKAHHTFSKQRCMASPVMSRRRRGRGAWVDGGDTYLWTGSRLPQT